MSREEIARRHGLPAKVAAELRGETPAELEADAAARAAIIQMFGGPGQPASEQAPEQSIEELADEELAAREESLKRILREQERRRDEQQQKTRAEVEADANRTPEQAHADTITEAISSKAEQHRAFIDAVHGGDET